jgi:hypothetical protein
MTGILIDSNELKRLSDLMETEIARLTGEIHAMAGKPFNISSPQQLGRVLFEELKLPAPVKYGKGKTISTAADVLEDLAEEHEIVRKVLEYRQLTKLKGTYVDALPALTTRGRAACTPVSTRPVPPRAGSPSNESAQHSHSNRAGSGDSHGIHPASWMETRRCRLFADRAAPAGPHVARRGARGSVP